MLYCAVCLYFVRKGLGSCRSGEFIRKKRGVTHQNAWDSETTQERQEKPDSDTSSVIRILLPSD